MKDLEAKVDLGSAEIKKLVGDNTNLIRNNALETENKIENLRSLLENNAIKSDGKFDELKALVQNTKLETENNWPKKIIMWSIPIVIIVIPAMISLFNRLFT